MTKLPAVPPKRYEFAGRFAVDNRLIRRRRELQFGQINRGQISCSTRHEDPLGLPLLIDSNLHYRSHDFITQLSIKSPKRQFPMRKTEARIREFRKTSEVADAPGLDFKTRDSSMKSSASTLCDRAPLPWLQPVRWLELRGHRLWRRRSLASCGVPRPSWRRCLCCP